MNSAPDTKQYFAKPTKTPYILMIVFAVLIFFNLFAFPFISATDSYREYLLDEPYYTEHDCTCTECTVQKLVFVPLSAIAAANIVSPGLGNAFLWFSICVITSFLTIIFASIKFSKTTIILSVISFVLILLINLELSDSIFDYSNFSVGFGQIFYYISFIIIIFASLWQHKLNKIKKAKKKLSKCSSYNL